MGQIFSLKNCLKEIASPDEYCLSLGDSAGPENASGPQFLKTKKNNIFLLQRRQQDALFSSICFSQLKCSFFSPTLFTQVATIRVRKLAFLELAVRQYIKKLSLFDKGFHFSYNLIAFNGEQAMVNIYVMQPDEGDNVLRSVPYSSVPVSTFVPVELVFNELLGNTFTNPVVSFWANEQYALFLVTHGREIISRTVFTYENGDENIVDWVLSNNYIQQAIESAKHRFPETDISFLVWGEHYKDMLRKLAGYKDIRIDEYLEDKISDKLDWTSYYGGYLKGDTAHPKGLVPRNGDSTKPGFWDWKEKRKRRSVLTSKLSKDMLFSNPSLYGLAVCEQSTSFISQDYKKNLSVYMRSRHALIVSFLCFIVFGAANAFSYFNQIQTEHDIAEVSEIVGTGIRQISTVVPGKEMVEKAVFRAGIKKEVISELNTVHFLSWLTNISPENAVIDNLSVTLEPEEVQKKKKRVVKEQQKKEKRYLVDLTLKVDRSYADAIAKIDVFFGRLNERVLSPQTRFIYKDAGDKVPSALSMKFIIQADKFL